MVIRIGTRGSKLAIWQAKNAQDQLRDAGHKTEIHVIKTKGDRIQDLGFDKMEGKGFFTKDIEEALLNEKIDLAVHSLKDLPTEGVDGLVIGGLSARENPSDILIIHSEARDPSKALKLIEGARVGTSSIRRKTQLKYFDPSVKTTDIRGNVPTRIDKLRRRDVDAVVLATAGINRLGLVLTEFTTVQFNPNEFIPAPGQGVIAYQCRADHRSLRTILKSVHHREVAACTNVERKILRLLKGGCQLPLGAYCYTDANGNYHCSASYSPGDQFELQRVSVAQSTFAGLAEAVVERFVL